MPSALEIDEELLAKIVYDEGIPESFLALEPSDSVLGPSDFGLRSSVFGLRSSVFGLCTSDFVLTLAMILHVDMDAFYASIEIRDDPSLVGRPVVVGGSSSGRGVVSAASYEARKFGIHSAMPAATAVRLCPQAVFLPVRMRHYIDVSRQIRTIFDRFTPLVEPLSLDEAFLDVTGSTALFGDAVTIGRAIQQAIRDELALPASIGIAASKFIAKVASDLEKPNGFVYVPREQSKDFLAPLPVSKLWGVGKVAAKKLERLGIHTIFDLRQVPATVLVDTLGAWGQRLVELANAVDDRAVVPEREAKTVSHETTFAHDEVDRDVLATILIHLVESVGYRLRQRGLRAGGVQVKIRYADFHTVTRAQKLREPTHTTQALIDAATALFSEQLPKRPSPLRLLGFEAHDLRDRQPVQRLLFDDANDGKQTKLDAAADAIRARFGHAAIGRGATTPPAKAERRPRDPAPRSRTHPGDDSPADRERAAQVAAIEALPRAPFDAALERLAKSNFRRRFALGGRDAEYLAARGLSSLVAHALALLAERLAVAEPRGDGKQTPMRGHPVFVAQHATATCCRGCLEKWHRIPKGRPLSRDELHFVVGLIRRWLERQAER